MCDQFSYFFFYLKKRGNEYFFINLKKLCEMTCKTFLEELKHTQLLEDL